MHKYSKKAIKKRKEEVYNFMRRLYYLIRHHSDKIDFQKLHHGVYGYYYDDTKEIVIDYRREIIPTLIHESLHHFHSDWSETKVQREETRIMNILTARQIKNTLKVIVDNL